MICGRTFHVVSKRYVTKYGHASVCQCGCADAGDGILPLNRVHSGMFLCSLQSAIERRVIVTLRVICRKNGKYFVIYL